MSPLSIDLEQIPSGQLSAALKAQALKHAVARYRGYGELKSLRHVTKRREYQDAKRFVCAYLMMASLVVSDYRRFKILSAPQIAKWLERGDHTTILYAKKLAYEREIVEEVALRQLVSQDIVEIEHQWEAGADWDFVPDSNESSFTWVNGSGWVRPHEVEAALLRARNAKRRVRLEVVKSA